MKLRIPDYYTSFQCLADKCKDSCCIGWEIDIDEDTLEYYESVTGTFGTRLKENIVDDGEDTSFVLKNGRCAFLNDKNLCDICIELGETSLCEICLEYPRFTLEYGMTREKCLGLSCEEAGRLIFEREQSVTFEESYMEEQYEWQEEQEGYEESEGEDDDSWSVYLEPARDYAIQILQDRSMAIEDRVKRCLCFAENIQEAMNERRFETFEEIIASETEAEVKDDKADAELKFSLFKQRMQLYKTLELLDEEWEQVWNWMNDLFQSPQIYKELHSNLCKHYKNRERDYENLLVYFLFRYGMKAVYDYNFLEKVKFAVISFLVIRDMDAERYARDNRFTLEERIDTARIYSKEVEHSEDNLEILAEACVFEEAMQMESLLKSI